jgi:hypothetical protein
MTKIPALALPNLEHLGAANRADSLSRRLAILHFDSSRILHFPLGSALHTIRLHPLSPFSCSCDEASTKLRSCQDGARTILKNVVKISFKLLSSSAEEAMEKLQGAKGNRTFAYKGGNFLNTTTS